MKHALLLFLLNSAKEQHIQITIIIIVIIIIFIILAPNLGHEMKLPSSSDPVIARGNIAIIFESILFWSTTSKRNILNNVTNM